MHLRRFLLPTGLAVALSTIASATTISVSASLSANNIATDASTPLTLTVENLGTGDSVIFERYVDTNADGAIDTGSDYLVQAGLVTDGGLPKIGGVRVPTMPGDEDATADGTVKIDIAPFRGAELGRVASQQILRVSSPTDAFTPIVLTFSVTAPTQGQALSGTVAVGGTPVPFAGVAILQNTPGSDGGDFVTGTVADASGHYSIPLPTGSYQVLPVCPGYVTDSGAAPSVDLTAGVDQTANLALVTATRHLSGSLYNSATESPARAIQIFAQDTDGYITLGSSDMNGSFDLPVTAGQWTLEASDISLAQMGFVGGQRSEPIDTTSGDVTNIPGSLDPATTLIYGHVTKPGGLPVADCRLYAYSADDSFSDDAVTDATGYYAILATDGYWGIGIDQQNNPAVDGFLFPASDEYYLEPDAATPIDFALYTANAHLQGDVKDPDGNPLAHVPLFAHAYIYDSATGSYGNINVFGSSDDLGHFDLAVVAPSSGIANWNISISHPTGSDPASDFIGGGDYAQVSLANSVVTDLLVTALPATSHLSGTLTRLDGQPIANAQVNAWISFVKNNVYYSFSTYAQSDDQGHYSLPLVGGTWYYNIYSQYSGEQSSRQLEVTDGVDLPGDFTLPFLDVLYTAPTGAGESAYLGSSLYDDSASFQWQISTDDGQNWSDLSDDTLYSGTHSPYLQIEATPASLDGAQFRYHVDTTYGSGYSSTATLVVESSYTAFAQQHFSASELLDPSISGEDADPDGDGLSNLLEYYFNTDPRTASAAPVVSVVDGYLQITFNRRTDSTSLEYRVETSTDLSDGWTWNPSNVTELSAIPIDGSTERVTVRSNIPVSQEPRAFLRLEIVENRRGGNVT